MTTQTHPAVDALWRAEARRRAAAFGLARMAIEAGNPPPREVSVEPLVRPTREARRQWREFGHASTWAVLVDGKQVGGYASRAGAEARADYERAKDEERRRAQYVARAAESAGLLAGIREGGAS